MQSPIPILIPNRDKSLPLEQLQTQLPQAVAKAWMIEKRDVFELQIDQKLDEQLKELERLRERQLQQLELELKSSRLQENRKVHKRAIREQDIKRLFDQYTEWMKDTMTTERQPWLQVIAVLTHPGSAELHSALPGLAAIFETGAFCCGPPQPSDSNKMPITDIATTYIGINNENEFYSHHYLSEVFKDDIKATLVEWSSGRKKNLQQKIRG